MSALTREEQLEALRAANRRLAIIGKFSSADEAAQRWTFSTIVASEEGRGPLDEVEFFERIRPELRTKNQNDVVSIGDKLYQKYHLVTPLEAGASGGTESQPLTLDSPLFELDIDGGDGGIPPQEVQAQGGNLFRTLLADLDRVAHFSRSSFTRALLKLSRHYVLQATKGLLDGDRINDLEWYGMLEEGHELSTGLVKYLTCHVGDEVAVRREIRAALSKAFPNTSSEKRQNRVEALVASVKRCKEALLASADPAQKPPSSGAAGADPILASLGQDSTFSPWFADFAADPEYGFLVPGLGATTFLEHYRAFFEASSSIHRLLRSEALHPLLFGWLASKYRAHGQNDRHLAALEMFRVGVKEQDDRVPGLSEQQKEEIRRRIQEAEVGGTEDLKKLSREFAVEQPYKLLMRQSTDDLERLLIRRSQFTRGALRERLTGLFVDLGLTAKGGLGELRRQALQTVKGYVRFFEVIENSDHAEEGAVRDLAFFQAVLEKKVQTDDQTAFVEGLLADLGAEGAALTEGELQERLSGLCVDRMAGASKAEATRGYLANRDEIRDQEELLRSLYRGHLGIEFQSEKAGMTVQVVDSWVLPEVEKEKKVELDRRRTRQLGELYQAKSAEARQVVKVPLPKQLSVWSGWDNDEVRAEARAEIRVEEETVGEFRFKDGGLEIALSEGVDPALLNTEGVTVHNAVGEGEVELVDIEIPQLRDLAAEREKQEEVIEALGHHAELVRYRDAMVAKYQGEDEEADESFGMGLRALTLGEYLLSAPEGAVRLDQPDVSCVLGVLLDMVEHIGDRQLGETLYEPGPTSDLKGLNRLNLSTYFPVVGDQEMLNVLIYYYELSDELLKVRDYLREVREIRDLIRTARGSGDLEIEVINDTLPGAVASWNDNPRDSLFSDRAATVAYLTRQGGDAGAGLAAAARHLFSVLSEPAAVPRVQLPIFAGPASRINSHGLPWVSPDLVQAPRLWELGRTKDGNLEVRGAVEAEPLLTLSAALLSPGIDLGTVVATPVSVLGLVKDRLHCPVAPGQPVRELLRDAWRLHPGLASQLLLAKWLSIAILWNRGQPRKAFGAVIQDALKDSGWRGAAFPELDGFAAVEPSLESSSHWLVLDAVGEGTQDLSRPFGTQGRAVSGEVQPLLQVGWKNAAGWSHHF